MGYDDSEGAEIAIFAAGVIILLACAVMAIVFSN